MIVNSKKDIDVKKEQLPHLLSASDVCDRIGVTKMSLWRWENDDKLNFPKPLRIKTNRYWPECEIATWLEQQREGA